MRRTTMFCVGLVVCSLLMIGGVSAQGDFTDEELDWIELVADAYSNTATSESFSIEYEQTMTQEISGGTGSSAVTITNEITQSMEAQIVQGDDGLMFSAIIEQSSQSETSGQTTEIELTMEMVLYDGELYLRFSDISPRALRGSFPDDWVSVSEDIDEYPFLESFNTDMITTIYESPLNIPIDEDSVLAIEEQDSEEVDGQEVRVFEMEYDAEALFNSEAMSSLLSSFETMAQGVDMEDLVAQMAEGAEVIYTVWVDEEEELIYRMDSVINIDTTIELMGMEFDFVQETQATTLYGDFGEDFEIEEPDA